jgi:hypothetical protein
MADAKVLVKVTPGSTKNALRTLKPNWTNKIQKKKNTIK